MNCPCAAVMGVVEGGSISVDDYMCRSTPGGKTVRARVERITAASGLELRTAQPEKAVWLMLRGRGAKQIRIGDVLEPPTSWLPQTFHNHRGPHRDPQHPADR